MRHREVRIRRANLRDLDALIYQRHCVFESMGCTQSTLERLDRDYERWVRRRLISGSLIGWIVENRIGDIVGGGVLWLRPNARPPPNPRVLPYLTSMYTEPAYRGRGIASLVVREAIRWSKANGYPTIVLHTSPSAKRFYPHFGFIRTWEMQCDLA
jgi:GNAT superfamily N-acetyltransferase